MSRLFFSNRKHSMDNITTNTSNPGLPRVWRLLSFAKPYGWKLVGITLVTFIISSMTIIYPALTGTIIDSVVERNADALHNIIYLVIGFVLVQALLSFWVNFWLVAIGERIVTDLRIQLYSNLQI